VSATQTDADRKSVCATLDDLVKQEREKRKNESYPVIIIFDEAQVMLEHKGWTFRCVRWWLRHPGRDNVVAIFSGTTASLANFFSEPAGAMTSTSH